MTAKSIGSAQSRDAYVIDCLVDHSNENGRWKFKVKLYRFASTSDTWEPIEGLPRSSIVPYLKKRRKVEWPPARCVGQSRSGTTCRILVASGGERGHSHRMDESTILTRLETRGSWHYMRNDDTIT